MQITIIKKNEGWYIIKIEDPEGIIWVDPFPTYNDAYKHIVKFYNEEFLK